MGFWNSARNFLESANDFIEERNEEFEKEVKTRQREAMDKVNEMEARGYQWGDKQEMVDNFKEKAHKNGIY